MRPLLLCLVLLPAGLISVAARGQAGASVLSVDDGSGVRSIARLVNGRWENTAKCVPHKTSDRPTSNRLVVSGELRVSDVRAVASGSAEWLRLAPTIIDLFTRREREQRLASDRTSGAPRAVDWIYVAPEGNSRTYYFEASRRVASPDDPDQDTDPSGTVRIAVAGFLQDTKERLIPLGTKSELRWEQDGLPAGPLRPDLEPLGIVHYGAGSVWVMRGQSGASAWFSLYQVDASGPRTALTVRPPRC